MSPTAAASAISPEALKAQIAILHEYADVSNIGVLICVFLFGIFVVQLYIYTTGKSFNTDSIGLKLLVAWVFACEVTHTGLVLTYYIPNLHESRLNPMHLLELSKPLSFAYWLSGVMGGTVQSFYAFRVWRLSRMWWFSILPLTGSIARVVVASIALNYALKLDNILVFFDSYSWTLKGVFAASVGVDLLITGSLCAILYSRRDKGQTYTRKLIDKLIVWTIETGMVTTIIAVLMLAFILVGPVIPGLVHTYPNFFSLSLLISLNTRDGLRTALTSSHRGPTSSISVTKISTAGATKHGLSDSLALQTFARPAEVAVDTETYEHVIDITQNTARMSGDDRDSIKGPMAL
ncbi:hypothetical protein BKA62DRAFT_825944 [Auriculariales sp. MPI-PUGE-AT-0066]|nr:hypothetical protein BKA62DRAFT_825944 [Auriculariales sp. MPI-PUGE-AT-0066]